MSNANVTVAPYQITGDLLREWRACTNGYQWFYARFPQGGSYNDVMDALYDDKRYADATWLVNHAFDAWFQNSGFIAEITSNVDNLVARIADSAKSVDAASVDGSALAASGMAASLLSRDATVNLHLAITAAPLLHIAMAHALGF